MGESAMRPPFSLGRKHAEWSALKVVDNRKGLLHCKERRRRIALRRLDLT
jgi:hypothetical protein